MNYQGKLRAGAIGALLMLLMPVMASAAVFRTSHEYTIIPKSEVINDDVYVASGNVTVSGTINGDLFVAGGQVRIDGTVRDSVTVAGGQLTVSGSIGRSLRAAGGNVVVEGNVGRDLLAAGGSIEVAPAAVISGDGWISGGSVAMAGEIKSLHAAAGQLYIASTARIDGPVSYQSKDEAKIEPGSTISGAVSRLTTPTVAAPAENTVKKVLAFGVLLKLLSTIVAALLFVYLFPRKSEILAADWQPHFGKNLLWGILVLIVTPVVVVMLMMTVIGIGLGLALLAVYLLALYLGGLVGVMAVGTWLQRKWDPSARPAFAAVIIGAVLLIVLQIIPLVGALIGVLVFMAGLGALVQYDWQLVRQQREDKKT